MNVLRFVVKSSAAALRKKVIVYIRREAIQTGATGPHSRGPQSHSKKLKTLKRRENMSSRHSAKCLYKSLAKEEDTRTKEFRETQNRLVLLPDEGHGTPSLEAERVMLEQKAMCPDRLDEGVRTATDVDQHLGQSRHRGGRRRFERHFLHRCGAGKRYATCRRRGARVVCLLRLRRTVGAGGTPGRGGFSCPGEFSEGRAGLGEAAARMRGGRGDSGGEERGKTWEEVRFFYPSIFSCNCGAERMKNLRRDKYKGCKY